MHNRRHYIYPDKETLVEAFVCEFQNVLKESVEAGKPFNLAISGGTTPLAIFEKLKEVTTREQWSAIQLYWGDERCVEPGDPQSNYGQTRKILLDALDLPKEQIHRIRGEEHPPGEASRYGQLILDNLPVEKGYPVFDWIWLGLGNDGHTASIFPHQIEYWNSEDPCMVATHPESGQQRISITGGVINAAKRVTFIATGKDKSAVINEIVMKEGKFMDYPAFYVAPSSGYLEWYMDQEATSWL